LTRAERFTRATITLYLSKSVRFLRACCLAIFLPHGRRPLALDVRRLERRGESLLGGRLLALEVHHDGGERQAAEGDHAALDGGGIDENLDTKRG